MAANAMSFSMGRGRPARSRFARQVVQSRRGRWSCSANKVRHRWPTVRLTASGVAIIVQGADDSSTPELAWLLSNAVVHHAVTPARLLLIANHPGPRPAACCARSAGIQSSPGRGSRALTHWKYPPDYGPLSWIEVARGRHR